MPLDTPLTTTKSPFWWIRWVPTALFVAVVTFLLIVLGRPVLLPLLVSFALTFILEPLVAWFEKRRIRRRPAVVLAMLTVSLSVVVLIVFVAPSVWNQLNDSIRRLPDAIGGAGVAAQGWLDWIEAHAGNPVLQQVQRAIDDLKNDPHSITQTVGTWLTSGLFGLVNFGSTIVGLVIVPFFVYYLLVDADRIRQTIERHIPERFRDSVTGLLDEIGLVARAYVKGRFLVALSMAGMYAAGLLMLGVPLWAGIGLLSGIIGIVPYLGVLSGMTLAIGFAVVSGAGPLKLLGVVAVFAVAQLIDDYILTPRLIGDRLELHPMVVFIGLIVSGHLFGLIGFVLAIPVLGVLKVVFEFLDEFYLRSDFFRGQDLQHPEPKVLRVREAVKAVTGRLTPPPGVLVGPEGESAEATDGPQTF